MRLRVGLRTLNAITGTQLAAADGWEVRLFDPGDNDRGSIRVGGPARARDVSEVVARRRVGDRVVFDLGPPEEDAGDWKVRVSAFEVNKTADSEVPLPPGRCTSAEQEFCEPTFAELRAVLEAEDRSPVQAKPLFPDLEAVPPFNMEFGCQPPASLAPEEPAAVCLRAAFGYGNFGDGPLELKFQRETLTDLTADVVQHVFFRDATPWRYADNTSETFPAGTASYHATHGHWHYDNIFIGRLFRVNPDFTFDPTPVVSAKLGNCAHDGILVRWKQTFFSEAKGTNDGGEDCEGLFTDLPTNQRMRIGLSRGWADVYAASLPDQYFDFTNEATSLDRLGNGKYLAQLEIDKDGKIHELDEDNNFGYTLFEISDFNAASAANPELARTTIKISILERGRGTSHLDPKKVRLFGIAE